MYAWEMTEVNCLCVGDFRSQAPDLDPYVTRETLQEMSLEDLVLIPLSSDYDAAFADESGYDFDARGA
jgi:hypothetical protein